MSNRTAIARIAAGIEAQQQLGASQPAQKALAAVKAQIARHGYMFVPGLAPSKPRRRAPSMPKVTLDTRPTPERASKAPGGVEQVNGSRAYRVRSSLDAIAERMTDEETAVASRLLRDWLVAEAGARQRLTANHNGAPATYGGGARDGGVVDHARTAFTTMALLKSTVHPNVWQVLKKLVVGVVRELDGRPWTLEEIAREFLPKPYKGADANRGVAVGMLKCALWTAAQFYTRERALTKNTKA